MKDITQFTLTDRAVEVAEKFVEDGWFKNNSEVGSFAAAYFIKYHFGEIDPSTLSYASSSHNYNYNSFDPEGRWEDIIKNLYNTEVPHLFMKNIMTWGLEKMGSIIDEHNGMLQITDFV